MILRTAITLALAPLLSCYLFAQGPGPGEAAPGGNAGTAGSGIGNVSGAGSGGGNFPGTAGSGIGNVPGTIVRPQFYSPPSSGGGGIDLVDPGGNGGLGTFYGGSRWGGGTWWTSGLADYVRSQGEYNLMSSEAILNLEDAREQFFENRNLAQQIWFEMRERNNAYRAEQRGPRITSEQVFRLNAQRAPKRLAEGQIDPVSGELSWPGVLREGIYTPYRGVIDEGFAIRTRSGSFPDYETHKKTVQAVDELAELLRSRIREYEPQPYVEANSFVEALAYDVRFPSG